jgi:hypothetical protein
VSYLRGLLDLDGYPLVAATVRPSPRAQVQSDPTPRPEAEVKAVIDTGANHSGLSPDVAQSLGLIPIAVAEVDRIGVTGAAIAIFPVRILIPATEGAFKPFDVHAGGVRPSTRGADVIIGNDILKKLTFTYRGPLRDFILSSDDDTANGEPKSDVLFHLSELGQSRCHPLLRNRC